MRWPIRYQILVPFAGMILAAVLSVSLLNAYWAASQSQRQIEEQLRSVARTLLTSSFPLTQNVLEQMRGLSGAEFVLTDDRGHRLATSGLAGQDVPPAGPVTDRWQDLRLAPLVTMGGERFFHVALRAGRHGGAGQPATLHVLYPERELRSLRRDAAIPPLVVGGCALVLCVAIATWIARRISLPLAQVRTQISRLAEGDFRLLPVPPRDDEVRDVAASVNQLARELDELRRAIARAERLSVLGRLSGGLAHDLRNGVAGALMAVQMHRRHCRTADQESLDVALRQLSLTEEHLKRFLAVGQPQQPRRSSFDICGLVDEVVTLLSPMARHRHTGLEFLRPTESAPVTISADRDQLRQALMNLLLNALETVGSEGRVRVELNEVGNLVRLCVLDNGPGLAAEMEHRVGEAFQTTKPEGVGLGLAVARQVAEAHGGCLVYSRIMDVTCFELSLAANAAAPAADRTQAPETAPSHELSGALGR